MIKIQDWVASIPEEEKHVAYVGEGMSETKEFFLCGDGWEEYTNRSFYLDMAFDRESVTSPNSREVVETRVNTTKNTEETTVNTQEITTKETYTVHDEQVESDAHTDVAFLDKQVEADGIRLTWTVQRKQTQHKGRLWATLRAVGSDTDHVKKSAIMVFEVDEAVEATPAVAPSVSEFEVMEARIAALYEQTRNSTNLAVSSASEAVQNRFAAEESANAAQAAADAALKVMPAITAEDNGKVLTVVDGVAVWVDNPVGDIEEALDRIIAIQESLINGVEPVEEYDGTVEVV